MNGSSALPYLVAAFLVYLYLPHVFFKAGAEKWVDLGRKKDSTQIEEFLSAALPSAAINVLASVFIGVPRFAIRFLILAPWHLLVTSFPAGFRTWYAQYLYWRPGVIDWRVVAAVLSPTLIPFTGSLYVPWSRVGEINITTEKASNAIRARQSAA